MRGAGSKLERRCEGAIELSWFFRRGLPGSGLSDRLLYAAPESEPDVRCQARLRWCFDKSGPTAAERMGDQPDTISKHRSFGRATTVRRRSSPHSDNLKEISTRPAIALKV